MTKAQYDALSDRDRVFVDLLLTILGGIKEIADSLKMMDEAVGDATK